MIPGTVTMSLSDVDALRKQITDKEKDIELAKKEIADIKAEKRVLKVWRLPNSNQTRISVRAHRLNSLERIIKDYSNKYGHGWSYCNYEDRIDLTREVDVSFTNMESSEYVNFEDVKAELLEELDKKYLGDLGKLKVIVGNHEVARSEEEEKRNIQTQQLTNDYERKIKDLNIILGEWKQKYDDLESDKKRISREEELQRIISDLIEKVKIERAKPWWRKLLGLK